MYFGFQRETTRDSETTTVEQNEAYPSDASVLGRPTEDDLINTCFKQFKRMPRPTLVHNHS